MENMHGKYAWKMCMENVHGKWARVTAAKPDRYAHSFL
jgi:hypothetical protein